MNSQLYEQLEQATARIEQLLHIGGMVAGSDSMPDPLRDLLDEDDETLTMVFPGLPDWVKEAMSDRDEGPDAFHQWVHDSGALGFVVQFATPLMRDLDSPGCGTFSWGSYYTHWVYGDTLEQAIERGLAWVDERRAREWEKAQAKAATQSAGA